jgi:multidrug transporter EmrE-like cation transporter
LGVVFYSRALRQIPIVIAYPVQVGTCILLIAAFAVGAFGERIGAAEALGIALVIGGIALLARVA